MKKISLLINFIFIVCFNSYASKIFIEELSEMSQVSEIKIIESKQFAEKYVIKFQQLIDYNNPKKGTFEQRVIVCNVHPDSATVLVTEGYDINYALRPSYTEELAKHFNTNLIVIEHRYFADSTPDNKDWKYLTTKFSANDIHNIVEAFKKIYKGKWISTGISKGGQTATFYRLYYPNDVDISVPYVAPLCRTVQDKRPELFIKDSSSNKKTRSAVKNFQIMAFQHKKEITPLLDSLSKANHYFYNAPIRVVFDYTILEFSFAFWQWGYNITTIPKKNASAREIYNYLVQVDSPRHFAKESPATSFFVQSAKELGYYGYDIKPFKKYTSIKNTDNYLDKLLLPKGKSFVFDDTLYKKILYFLKNTDAKMLYIYGENDPWSSVKIPDFNRENIKIFIQPNGSHKTRINTFNEKTQKIIFNQLSNWLYNKK
ncbi:MAG: S28 family serine protease [Bacteroidales bacterium]